jgi:putative Holliday junction resolvase
MRVLAVDPGEKRIGLALSDPGGVVARPLTSLAHEARERDAARIAALAAEHGAEMIVVGLALDASNAVGPQGRRAERLAAAIRQHTHLPVALHDESFSTRAAQHVRRALARAGPGRTAGRAGRAKSRADEHAVAAAAILQSFLDERPGRDQET